MPVMHSPGTGIRKELLDFTVSEPETESKIWDLCHEIVVFVTVEENRPSTNSKRTNPNPHANQHCWFQNCNPGAVGGCPNWDIQ